MKYERCLAKLEIKESKEATAIIPKNVFKNIESGQCIVIKKAMSDVLKFFQIPKEANVYELYAEIKEGGLGDFIIATTDLTRNLENVEIIPDATDGGCPGKQGQNCTFDGFLLLKGNATEVISVIKEKLMHLKDKNGNITIIELSIEEVTNI